MNFLQGKITELKQKIGTNERDYRNETDPLQRQSLKEIIERDTVTLNNLYVQLTQIQSTQSAPLLQQYGQNVAAPAPNSQYQVSQAQPPAPFGQGKNIDCNFIPNDLETWSGPLQSTSYFALPQPITSYFLLQEINGRLASLSGERGFRNYVQRRLTAIGVSGYIQRVAHNDADLVVRGTFNQITEVEEFLEEIRGTLIESSFEINQPPKYLPTGRRFEIKKSDQKVHTGTYSDPGLAKLSVSSRSDTPILNSPDTHSDKGGD